MIICLSGNDILFFFFPMLIAKGCCPRAFRATSPATTQQTCFTELDDGGMVHALERHVLHAPRLRNLLLEINKNMAAMNISSSF